MEVGLGFLPVLFFVIAFVYASAGFGGGSSYLAVMALWGVQMATMRTTALWCNMIVVAGGTWIFWKNGYLHPRRMLLLCMVSVPCAFLGAALPLREKVFFLLLGSSLVVAACLMLFQKMQLLNQENTPEGRTVPLHWHLKGAFWGGGIGFLSGMVGIGGGIFLSPLLHFLRWGQPKEIAATASFFILVNSAAGLLGQWWQQKGHFDLWFVLPLGVAVLLGGQAGSRLSALRLPATRVRQATALLILYAGLNILWSHW